MWAAEIIAAREWHALCCSASVLSLAVPCTRCSRCSHVRRPPLAATAPTGEQLVQRLVPLLVQARATPPAHCVLHAAGQAGQDASVAGLGDAWIRQGRKPVRNIAPGHAAAAAHQLVDEHHAGRPLPCFAEQLAAPWRGGFVCSSAATPTSSATVHARPRPCRSHALTGCAQRRAQQIAPQTRRQTRLETARLPRPPPRVPAAFCLREGCVGGIEAVKCMPLP